MTTRTSWTGGSLLLALGFTLLALPEADARGGRGGGGHSGGHAARAPHISAANRASKMPNSRAPKMPRAAAPARSNAGRNRTNNAQMNNAQNRSSNAQARANKANANLAATTGVGNSTGNLSNTTGTAGVGTTSTSANSSPYHYTYGSGSNARRYRAYGYGRGYRNRSYGNNYGYGRSQSSNRAVVARLRSAHSSLAHASRDYQGHRSRAMHQIRLAIRQLSHRSMIYGNSGFTAGMNNNNLAMGRRQGGLGAGAGAGAGARRNQGMAQGQSDALVSQALRTLQGVNMQLTSQGTNTSGHARARGHVQHAIRELNTALAIR